MLLLKDKVLIINKYFIVGFILAELQSCSALSQGTSKEDEQMKSGDWKTYGEMWINADTNQAEISCKIFFDTKSSESYNPGMTLPDKIFLHTALAMNKDALRSRSKESQAIELCVMP